MGKARVLFPLGEALANAVEVPVLSIAGQSHVNGDALAQHGLERNILRVIRLQVKLETEKVRNGFVPREPGQEQVIVPQPFHIDGEGSFGLQKRWHGFSPTVLGGL
jgi:hypothetical protein